ncbi:MAG: hypothetical protein HY913_17045 [Desulfomonile tiedjei]|nr:hypothetical protein [Desulfomonile tiedjei]
MSWFRLVTRSQLWYDHWFTTMGCVVLPEAEAIQAGDVGVTTRATNGAFDVLRPDPSHKQTLRSS